MNSLEVMFKSGDQVAEYLRLVRLLGAGGMGSVWVADHLRLRTQVAVKFLSVTMLNNTAARSRFDREAQLVAQVKSPHVVQVLDQGITVTELPQPFIVMELLDGEDLGQLLERKQTLSIEEAYFILDQVCAGLGTAHGLGLVHRDIKPENIFLLAGDRPFVKILDFGIARATQNQEDKRLTHTGGVIGTAHYMSPEQLFEGKQADHRTDIWALGVVLYRAITGRLPFDGTTYGDLCLAVHRGVYTPASQLVPINPEIDGFIARALATDRNARFSTVKEFAAELATFVQRRSALPGMPITAGSLPGAVRATTADRGYVQTGTGPGTGPGAGPAGYVDTGTGPGAGTGPAGYVHPGTGPGTGPGGMAGTIRMAPGMSLGTGTNPEAPPQATDIGTTVNVPEVPTSRSGLVAVGALFGVLVLAGGVFAASRFWAGEPTRPAIIEETVPAGQPAAQAPSSAVTPPASPAADPADSPAPPPAASSSAPSIDPSVDPPEAPPASGKLPTPPPGTKIKPFKPSAKSGSSTPGTSKNPSTSNDQ
ncbi:MAG TPA: serine/threonine-protein kinase, partial [Polyangiaceae bacterium]